MLAPPEGLLHVGAGFFHSHLSFPDLIMNVRGQHRRCGSLDLVPVTIELLLDLRISCRAVESVAQPLDDGVGRWALGVGRCARRAKLCGRQFFPVQHPCLLYVVCVGALLAVTPGGRPAFHVS